MSNYKHSRMPDRPMTRPESQKSALPNAVRSIRHSSFVIRACLFCAALGLLVSAHAATATNRPPVTPRDFFNAGTEKLREGKWREAETWLQQAVASQDSRVQPPALYNLGHVRNEQGEEELKKSPEGHATAARGRNAAATTEAAVNEADAAMANPDVQKLLQAYMRGRGARRDLRDATRQIVKAMELHGAALLRWQRSAGDFRSNVELTPSDTNALQNAEVMDKKIAQLIDKLQQMQQAMAMMAQQGRRLEDRLRQMRGMIPEAMMPPGAAGDEEEQEDMPMGLRPPQVEPPGREGKERPISPEEAIRMLEGYKLDGNRRLPMGDREEKQPKDRKRSNW